MKAEVFKPLIQKAIVPVPVSVGRHCVLEQGLTKKCHFVPLQTQRNLDRSAKYYKYHRLFYFILFIHIKPCIFESSQNNTEPNKYTGRPF